MEKIRLENNLVKTAIAVALVVGLGIAVYAGSLKGVLVLDDAPQILRQGPVGTAAVAALVAQSPRPLVDLTLAWHHGHRVPDALGYHLLNLAIHLAAGLVLLGLLCRTFSAPVLAGRFGRNGWGLALVTALLWVVHPLQTTSVTVVLGRAEALAGLFGLLTLYAVLRLIEGTAYPRVWAGLSVAACWLGMMSSPTMVTAPLLVLFYDRIFWASSWSEIVRKRRLFYGALASSWLLWAFLASRPSGLSAGFADGVTWARSVLAQPTAFFQDLRLVFWPHPLVVDDGGFLAGNPPYSWPAMAVALVAMAGTAVALHRRSPLGFFGIWFLLVLVSGSVGPLSDLARAQRLYLPLAGVLVLTVVAGEALSHRLFPRPEEWLAQIGVVVVALLGILSFLTAQRNFLFQDPLALWAEELKRHPENPRAHYYLGLARSQKGDQAEARRFYQQALALRPDYPEAHNHLGALLFAQGEKALALEHYREALALNPRYAAARNNYGLALMDAGDLAAAQAHFEAAGRLEPDDPDTWLNLGNFYFSLGNKRQAKDYYERFIKARPGDLVVHRALADIYFQEGQFAQARRHYEQVLLFQPDDPVLHNKLGIILREAGDIPEALRHFLVAMGRDPDFVEARLNYEATTQQQTRSERKLRLVWPPPAPTSGTSSALSSPVVSSGKNDVSPADSAKPTPKKKQRK